MIRQESGGGTTRQVLSRLQLKTPILLILLLFAGAVQAQAATFTVNTTLDGSDSNLADSDCDANPLPGNQNLCTLRAAIEEANQEASADLINFSIPGCGAWCTIQLVFGNLPMLVDNGTTINGFSQPNTNQGSVGDATIPGLSGGCPILAFARPDVAIDANKFMNPLSIHGDASNITIVGLAIYDAGLTPSLPFVHPDGHAILALGGSGTHRIIADMFIGVLPDGTDPIAERNLEFGVRQLNGGRLEVYRSFIGWNGKGGIDSEASNSVMRIESNEVFESGWLSESHDGIDLNGVNSTARCNLSRDNTAFPDVLPTPQGDAGNGFEVGSMDASGVFDLDNIVIEDNTARDNLSAGVSIRKGATGIILQRNEIFGNEVGVSVNTEGRLPTNRNVISQNSTHRNMGLGIDLQHAVVPDMEWKGFATVPVGTAPGPDGVTPNDPSPACDADPGSNDLQNFPDLLDATSFSTFTNIRGSLDSTANTTFTIEFFATTPGGLFGMGDREGERFIGSVHVTTGPDCIATINHNVTGAVPEGDVITATATPFTDGTEPWSTSEYGGPVSVNQFEPEGKVTGGGWYYQPGTGHPSPGTELRRATFGFNAQYHKDDPQPKGHTNFVYRDDNGKLHLSSLQYEPLSLVVMPNGDGTGWARWRGTAKVDKDPNYCFRAYVEDNNEPGTADEWQIRIWRKSTSGGSCSNESATFEYDNHPANPPHGPGQGTVINGGNIQLHPPNP